MNKFFMIMVGRFFKITSHEIIKEQLSPTVKYSGLKVETTGILIMDMRYQTNKIYDDL